MPLKNKGDGMFRQPYPTEKQVIASIWISELKKQYRPNAGKGLRILAIASTAALILRTLISPAGVVDKIILGLFVAGCWVLATDMRKKTKSCEHYMVMLEQGAFLVMPAIAREVRTADDGYYYNGYVAAVSINGIALGQYRMPYDMANNLVQEQCQAAPILLVKVEGENEIVAISAPQ